MVPLRVLLVDDHEDLRFLLRTTLQLAKEFSVIAEADNGRSAVEQAARHQPDLVLLDMAMPVMDGLEALPLIRQVAPEAQVVVLSGFEERRLGPQALALGASAYLEKGLPPEALTKEVLAAISART